MYFTPMTCPMWPFGMSSSAPVHCTWATHGDTTAALRHCHVCHAELPPKHAVVSLKGHFFQFDGFHVPMSCTVTELLHRKSQSWFLVHFPNFPKTNRHLCRVVACPKRQDSERIRISRNSSPSPSIFRIFNDFHKFHIFIRARCPKNGILTCKGLRFFSKLFHLFSSDIPMTFLTFLTAEARTRTLRMVTDDCGGYSLRKFPFDCVRLRQKRYGNLSLRPLYTESIAFLCSSHHFSNISCSGRS